jgi:hypothetical protein
MRFAHYWLVAAHLSVALPALAWTPEVGIELLAPRPNLWACTQFAEWQPSTAPLTVNRSNSNVIDSSVARADPRFVVDDEHQSGVCQVEGADSDADGVRFEQRLRVRDREGGWLISEFGGEWGEDLWAQEAGSPTRTKLASLAVRRFIKRSNGEVLILAGERSSYFPTASIFSVDRSPPHSWMLSERFKYGEYPYASALKDDSILHIATQTSLIAVDLNTYEIISEGKAPWARFTGARRADGVLLSVRPTSMVVAAGGVVVGTTLGVVYAKSQAIGGFSFQWLERVRSHEAPAIDHGGISGPECGQP